MKAVHLSRTIGGLSTVLGVCWLWGVLVPTFQRFIAGGRDSLDFIFLFAVVPLVAIPGVLAVVFGIKLYRAVNLVSLKWIMGVLAFCGTLWISSGLSSLCGDLISKRVQTGIFLLVGIFVVVPIYLFVVGHLSRMLGLGKPKVGDLLGRGVLALIAWQLWTVLSAVIYEYCPKDEAYASVPNGSWSLIALFMPILISWVSYRVVVARWLSPRADPSHDSGNASNSINPPLTPDTIPPQLK
ncbi:MAG: hypothetical protein RLZZ214_1271 [Verrucomicrobiota bacterium]|jgi:hypothetical protein